MSGIFIPSWPPLLRTNGSHTATSAADVATYAFAAGQLGALDRLYVLVSVEVSTQTLNNGVLLRNVTDAVTIGSPTTTDIVAGDELTLAIILEQGRAGATSIAMMSMGVENASSTHTSRIRRDTSSVTTGYTSAWDFGVRLGAMTSGGTGAWSVAVWKL